MKSEMPNETAVNADLEPISSKDGMPPTTGFALRDANQHTFGDFQIDETPFQCAGAYAISDLTDQVVYMGYSKNVALKLSFHSRLQPQHCSTFRVYTPPVPPELISPDMLENVLEYWIREIGDVPRGNSVDRAIWEQETPIDRKVLFASIFFIFLASSIMKQVLYFTTSY